MPAEVVFTQVSPMDQHGYFSLGIAADYTMAAIRKARAVIVEGQRERALRLRQLPPPHLPGHRPGREQRAGSRGWPAHHRARPGAIGKYVADMIEDGSTLQIGYGGIPDAVVMQLTHKKDLGPHRDDR
jgi:acyl-CoA hydrolase